MGKVVQFWIFVIWTDILARGSAQYQAYVPNPVVQSSLGNSMNFTCQSRGIPIVTCLWERENIMVSSTSDLTLNFNSLNTNPGQVGTPGYSYNGQGLLKGDCGVTIHNLSQDDLGKWRCTLVTLTHQILRGVVDLAQYPGSTADSTSTELPIKKRSEQLCTRHRWISISNLSDTLRQEMYNFGFADKQSRHIYPCRVETKRPMRLGSFTLEDGFCRVHHYRNTVDKFVVAEVLSIPGGLSKYTVYEDGHIYRVQYELMSSFLLPEKMSSGSAIPIPASFPNTIPIKYVAFATLSVDTGYGIRALDIIGTAVKLNETESLAVVINEDTYARVRKFKYLVCTVSKQNA